MELDGLRGILSVIVVLGHLAYQSQIHWFDSMMTWFWMCMEIFFTISGFLVGRIVITGLNRPQFLRRYLIRRSLRIWPLYYVVVFSGLALALFRVWLGDQPEFPFLPSLTGMVKQLLYLQYTEYLWDGRLQYVYALRHSWSVALEEQFYLLAPLLVLLLVRLRLSLIVALAVAMILLSSALQTQFGVHWFLLPARMSGFWGGLLLAFVTLRQEQTGQGIEAGYRWVSWLAMPVTVWLFLSVWLVNPAADSPWAKAYELFGYMGLAAVYFGMFLVAAIYYHQSRGPLPILSWKPLVYLGEISYSTYLWHVLLLAHLSALFDHWQLSAWPRFAIAVPLLFGWAAFSYHYIELPFLRLKSRWRY